jgi:hypothetical protein
MEVYGHPDHERRIVKLEDGKLDRAGIATLSSNVEKLADAIARDHDVLVRLVKALATRPTPPR